MVSIVLQSPTAVAPVAPSAIWLPVPTAVLKPPAAITSREETPPLPMAVEERPEASAPLPTAVELTSVASAPSP